MAVSKCLKTEYPFKARAKANMLSTQFNDTAKAAYINSDVLFAK